MKPAIAGIVMLMALFSCPRPIPAQVPVVQLSAEQRLLMEEHFYGGPTEHEPILIRQRDVAGYNAEMRVPEWVAFHVKPECLQVLKRMGKLSGYPSREVQF